MQAYALLLEVFLKDDSTFLFIGIEIAYLLPKIQQTKIAVTKI